jgi:Tfp pilus assembly protein PilP
MRHSSSIKAALILVALMTVAGCSGAATSLICARVTEFPAEMQARAAEELASLPPSAALPGMLAAMASDRAFNRAICR